MAMTLKECDNIAQALIGWFESQDIEPAQGLTGMAYLIGIMSADMAATKEEVIQGCELAAQVTQIVALRAFSKR